MVTEFETVAFELEVGEISEPIQTDFGYHIIQVLGHQDIPLSATQYDNKKETEFTDWLAAAREEAEITTYDVWRTRVPTEPSIQGQALPQ